MDKIKCPICGNGELVLYVSSCTDSECCGLEHDIGCSACHYYLIQSFDLDEVCETWARLHGLIEKPNDLSWEDLISGVSSTIRSPIDK
jgi:hypothetical protein